MGHAERDTSEAQAFTPSAHAESRARPSLEDMHAARAIFHHRTGANGASDKDFLDLGDTGKLYLAQAPQNKPEYESGAGGRWHFENPRAHGNDIAGKLKEWLWNDAPNLPRDTVNGAWTVIEPLLKSANSALDRNPDLTYMEYLTGIEQKRDRSPWRHVSFEGSDRAYNAFPNLAQRGLPKELISGLILNEVKHTGDVRDFGEDLSVDMFGTVRNWDGTEDEDASIGPAQIQIRSIRHLVNEYPQLSEFKNDPLRSAIKPESAPMFVAAYITDCIGQIDQYNQASPEKPIPVTPSTIAYMYNHDVFRRGSEYKAVDTWDKVMSTLHLKNSMQGWTSERLPINAEVVDHSKVVSDVLDAMKDCKR